MSLEGPAQLYSQDDQFTFVKYRHLLYNVAEHTLLLAAVSTSSAREEMRTSHRGVREAARSVSHLGANLSGALPKRRPKACGCWKKKPACNRIIQNAKCSC